VDLVDLVEGVLWEKKIRARCELQSACIRGSSARLKKRRGLGVWFRRYSCISSFGIGVYSSCFALFRAC